MLATTQVASFDYGAPEILDESKDELLYKENVDFWGIGVILFQCASGEKLIQMEDGEQRGWRLPRCLRREDFQEKMISRLEQSRRELRKIFYLEHDDAESVVKEILLQLLRINPEIRCDKVLREMSQIIQSPELASTANSASYPNLSQLPNINLPLLAEQMKFYTALPKQVEEHFTQFGEIEINYKKPLDNARWGNIFSGRFVADRKLIAVRLIANSTLHAQNLNHDDLIFMDAGQHDHVVKSIFVYKAANFRAYAMEYCGESLEKKIRDSGEGCLLI